MNEKLNIQNLIDLLAERHGMSKKNADSFVKEFFQLIEEALEKDKYVKVKGLGTFKLIDVDSRESVNVNTGERFEIQGHSKISFTPEPALRDVINKPFSHFETVVLNDDTVFTDVSLEGDSDEEEETEPANKDRIVAAEKVIDEDILSSPKVAFEKIIDEKPSIAATKREEALKESDVIGEQIPANAATMKFFAGIVIFVVILCAGAIVYMCYPDLFNKSNANLPIKETVKSDLNKSADKVALADSSNSEKVIQTDVLSEPAVDPQSTTSMEDLSPSRLKESVSSIEESQKKIVAPKNYVYEGTEAIHIVEDGETLTKISQRFYATKSLWSFIVEYNADVIKNPDYVPAGTKIKIPKLVKKQ